MALKRIDDEQVEDVAGGLIHYAGGSFDCTSTYEVIHDKSGKVLAAFNGPTSEAFAQAQAKAVELGMSTDGITDNALDALRYRYNKGK